MNAPDYLRLNTGERRLLDHFYRQHGSRMRACANGEHWVARQPTIVAAVNLTEVDQGRWLTGLFVAAPYRNRGIAAGLVEAALHQRSGPTWLFCDPSLMGFYERLGFVLAEHLPSELASRLARYQRSKSLSALVRS
ncbi:GNAT family N-acetyltransferase [Pseudomonas sp. S75]|uniref:GNAT family N-acetyltransferase n=1 Tax=unclassified Pseudomonas TaxID=196821 RepID=UPI00190888E5|nr:MULTISPECIES: GNAT family N-acetyltransferase [unclassified Pseudomonas]MBJ9977131.1 GNAT family N-acetyltransferase [Pseudomonas sp. S30]MBK0154133.1 GNAT family N-acetyltransferase [Pseudomonas sp. S75]